MVFSLLRARAISRTVWLLAGLLLACAPIPSGAAEKKALKPWTGGPTPPLRLKDLQGKTHDLSEYRGKAVLVNFWATWCEPCREELPSMNRLKKTLEGQPFEVLAVDVGEEPAQIREFLAKLPVEFPVLLDQDSEAVREWKMFVLPTTFVLDSEGRIRYSYVGQLDWASSAVVNAIGGLMPKR